MNMNLIMKWLPLPKPNVTNVRFSSFTYSIPAEPLSGNIQIINYISPEKLITYSNCILLYKVLVCDCRLVYLNRSLA